MLLKELQQAFISAIDDPQQAEPILNQLHNNNDLSAAKRLAVYRDSMLANAISALELTYPRIKTLVGDEFFTGLAQRYYQQTSSDSPDLTNYGRVFAEFIDHFPPCNQLSYLTDMARLEWAWQTALYGPDANTLNFSRLASTMEEQGEAIIFHLPKNSTLLVSDYPLLTIWQLCEEQGNESPIDLSQGGCYLFIWRAQDDTLIELLTFEQWFVLDAFAAGLNMGRLCEKIELLPEPFDMGSIMADLTGKGVFVGFNKE